MQKIDFYSHNFFIASIRLIAIISMSFAVVHDSVAEEINQVEICAQVLSTPFPEKDRPTIVEKQALKGCDSDKLYYGYEKAGDSVNARKCAYIEMGPPDISEGPFNSTHMLMMIYANGEGVKRNLDLALRLACEDKAGTAPAEYEGRITHLSQMRHQKRQDAFDYCSDITSGMWMGHCSYRQAAREEAKRNLQFANLNAYWTASDKQAFQTMQITWKNYLKAREGEVDQSGTARGAMVVEDRKVLEQKFTVTLADFEKGSFPRYAESDFVKVDKELNLIYKQVQSAKRDGSMGTVTNEDIKLSQRAWLKYRDAWLIFARQKYPSVTEAAWKTWLTSERTAQLKDDNP